MRKDKAMEIFKDMLISGEEKMFDEQNISHFISFKFKKKITLIRHASLNMILSLGLVNGPRYIEAILSRIKLSKDLFLMDLELGI